MAYPMTWQRLIRRNHLTDGSYATTPAGWEPGVNTNSTVSPAAAFDVLGAQRDRLLRYVKQVMLLAGDIRRLEADGRDEEALCHTISERSGVPADAVATVLKEFFAL